MEEKGRGTLVQMLFKKKKTFFAFLSSFSINLLAFYHEWLRYSLSIVDSAKCSNVLVNNAAASAFPKCL